MKKKFTYHPATETTPEYVTDGKTNYYQGCSRLPADMTYSPPTQPMVLPGMVQGRPLRTPPERFEAHPYKGPDAVEATRVPHACTSPRH